MTIADNFNKRCLFRQNWTVDYHKDVSFETVYDFKRPLLVCFKWQWCCKQWNYCFPWKIAFQWHGKQVRKNLNSIICDAENLWMWLNVWEENQVNWRANHVHLHWLQNPNPPPHQHLQQGHQSHPKLKKEPGSSKPKPRLQVTTHGVQKECKNLCRCLAGCKVVSKCQHDLNQHVSTKHPAFRFKCKLCGAQYITYNAKFKHKRTHKAPSVVCPYKGCNKFLLWKGLQAAQMSTYRQKQISLPIQDCNK